LQNRIKIVSTDRLDIHLVDTNDAAFILEILNSPGWLAYIGDRGVRTLEDAEKYIQEKFVTSYELNGYAIYKMSTIGANTPIGLCGFVKRDFLEHPDIGFAILEPWEGKGYMLEAAKALLDYGKTALNFSTVLAFTNVENPKSQSLLIKLGLQANGKIKPYEDEEELLLFSTPNI